MQEVGRSGRGHGGRRGCGRGGWRKVWVILAFGKPVAPVVLKVPGLSKCGCGWSCASGEECTSSHDDEVVMRKMVS